MGFKQDKYTLAFQNAMEKAANDAQSSGHQQLTELHILKSLLVPSEETIIRKLVELAGYDPNLTYVAIEKLVNEQPKVSGSGVDGQVYMSLLLAKLLDKTLELAKKNGDEFGASERFLEAVLEDGTSKSVQIFASSGLEKSSLKKHIQDVRKGRKADSMNAEDTYQALKKYTVDLTARSRDGKLDPVIGRDEEIRRR